MDAEEFRLRGHELIDWIAGYLENSIPCSRRLPRETCALLSGEFTLRLCIGQRTTERRHVEHAWRLISEAAQGPVYSA